MMVSSTGSKAKPNSVTLEMGDWIKIGIGLFTHLVALGVLGVTMWTKMAVIEQRMDHNRTQLEKLERTVDKLHPVRLTKVVKRNGLP